MKCLTLIDSGVEPDGSPWTAYDEVPCLRKGMFGQMVWNKPAAQWVDTGEYIDQICDFTKAGLPVPCSVYNEKPGILDRIGEGFNLGNKGLDVAKLLGWAAILGVGYIALRTYGPKR